MRDWQQRIADTRSQIEAIHRTPPLADCLAYAVTEAAEALDAVLRIERAGDDRTRSHAEKDAIGRELAQTAYMLGTAANLLGYDLGPLDSSIAVTVASGRAATALAVAMVQAVARAFSSGSASRMTDVLEIAQALARRYGVDLSAELDLWLAELRGRHPATWTGLAWTQDRLPDVEPDLPLFGIRGGEA